MNKTHVSARVALLFIWVLAAFLAAACSRPAPAAPTASTTTAPARGGTLTLLGADPPTLDPALAGDATSGRYVVEIFSGLVTLDRDLNVVPDLAESWEEDPSHTVYTFHLRPDARFQDGKPVTAADVKYSLERATDPATRSSVASSYLGDIVGARDKLQGRARELRGVRVLDERTLEITIDAPRAYFLAKLTMPTAYIVDKDNVASGPGWALRPNGTGPFRLQEWRERERLVLVRNPYYHRGPVHLDEVRFILSGGLALSRYERGEIDVVGVGSANIERALDPLNRLHRDLVEVSELSVQYIGFNAGLPPFDDPLVRRAFSQAVDKEKIARVTLKGLARPAAGILPPGIPGFNEDLVGLSYNPAEARRLLAASRYPDLARYPIVISAPGAAGMVGPVTEAVAAMWQENLGASVQVHLYEWPTYLEELRTGRFQVFGGFAWQADYADPENFLDILFHSGSEQNFTAYANPEADALLEEAAKEQDSERRLSLYQQAERMIVADAPALPISFGRGYELVKPYVRGYQEPPITRAFLKDVWIEGR